MPEAVDLSVIVPCFNEEENLPGLAARTRTALEGMKISWEMILVDDGSRDRTRERIQAASRTEPRIRGAFHEKNRGIVAGWVTGLLQSRGRFVLPLDADLQYRPEDIPRLWAAGTETGADLVQGWRAPADREDQNRQGYSRLFSRLLNIVFGMNLKDNKSGFILYRREAMEKVMAEREGFRLFQHFVTVASHALGYRMVEVPVAFDRRQAGASFITNVFFFALRAFLDFPLALWKFRIARRQS